MLHNETRRSSSRPVDAGGSSSAAAAKQQALAEALSAIGTSIRCARNSEVYGEGEPADTVYMVVSGAVRTYKLLSDGRRQIGDFHIEGEVFGLEAGVERQFTAEAIADSVVLVAKRSALVGMAAHNADLAYELWVHTAGELQRAQDHLLLLGRKRAQERVATFLLDMAGRRKSEIFVDLPMSRQDIADYLGLTIETVSRAFSKFKAKGYIRLHGARSAEILRVDALRSLSS